MIHCALGSVTSALTALVDGSSNSTEQSLSPAFLEIIATCIDPKGESSTPPPSHLPSEKEMVIGAVVIAFYWYFGVSFIELD